MCKANTLTDFATKSKSEIVWINAQSESIPVGTMSNDYLSNLIKWTDEKIKEGIGDKLYLNRTFNEWNIVFNNVLEDKTVKVEAKKIYDALRIRAAKFDSQIAEKTKEINAKSKKLAELNDQVISFRLSKESILNQALLLQKTWGF